MPQHEPSCEPKARRPWDFLRTKFCPKHGPISSLPWWPWGISKSFRPNVPWNPDVYSYPKKCANHLVNGNFRNRLIGGTYHIFLAYFSGLCKWISPENMALYGTVPPFYDPEIPIDLVNRLGESSWKFVRLPACGRWSCLIITQILCVVKVKLTSECVELDYPRKAGLLLSCCMIKWFVSGMCSATLQLLTISIKF
jgi:hypothetical protein